MTATVNALSFEYQILEVTETKKEIKASGVDKIMSNDKDLSGAEILELWRDIEQTLANLTAYEERLLGQ
jgi:hypothetical protein